MPRGMSRPRISTGRAQRLTRAPNRLPGGALADDKPHRRVSVAVDRRRQPDRRLTTAPDAGRLAVVWGSPLRPATRPRLTPNPERHIASATSASLSGNTAVSCAHPQLRFTT
jgi:hypothetical protein